MAEWRCRIGCVVLAAAMIGLAPTMLFAQGDGEGASKPEAQQQQPRPRGYADTKYHLTMYEVEKFSDRLGLSVEQHELMVIMFSEMRRRVFEAEQPLRGIEDEWITLMREAYRGDRSELDAKLSVAHQKRVEARSQESAFDTMQMELTAEFLEDLSLLLEPEQVGRLDDAMRWRHRHRLLRWGMIPYSDFSVASVARSMDLSVDSSRFDDVEAPSLESIYKEYEIELDRLLVRRVEAERRFAPGARGMGGSRSGTSSIDSEEDKEKWRVAVGEVNLRLVNMQKKYIRRIASLLKPQDAAEFQQRCYEKGYWHVLGDSEMERRFAEVIEHPLLTGEQRSQVEAMRDAYRAARVPIERRWIRALDDFLAKGGARVAGAEVPASMGDPMDETDDADGLFD
ncbi:MAG: hypothetical protein ACNA8P_11630, partial [Phycisphaerales bacterium]